jgi:DNA-binding response OmpR family regulator
VETRHTGPRVVMVVEDDANIERVVQRALKREGYKVLVAPRPAEALDTARVFGSWVDLVLCDSGALASELATLLPDSRVELFAGSEVELDVVQRVRALLAS